MLHTFVRAFCKRILFDFGDCIMLNHTLCHKYLAQSVHHTHSHRHTRTHTQKCIDKPHALWQKQTPATPPNGIALKGSGATLLLPPACSFRSRFCFWSWPATSSSSSASTTTLQWRLPVCLCALCSAHTLCACLFCRQRLCWTN